MAHLFSTRFDAFRRVSAPFGAPWRSLGWSLGPCAAESVALAPSLALLALAVARRIG